MKNLILIGTTLSVALLSSTAMATDFQALTVLQGATPVALQDSELATTEGGATCSVPGARAGNGNPGGVALCSEIGGAQGAHFAVANDAPVTGANFLSVTGGL
ncbi:MAG: hypothetical protein V3U87_14835 [Methylococcaceae bacterium]